MSVISLFLVLILIGVLIWAVTTYVPMDAGIKNIIRVVGVVIAVWYALSAFGVIGSLHHVDVPRFK